MNLKSFGLDFEKPELSVEEAIALWKEHVKFCVDCWWHMDYLRLGEELYDEMASLTRHFFPRTKLNYPPAHTPSR